MFDLNKASQSLEEIELRFEFDGAAVEVQWFRVMQTAGNWCIARHTHSFYEFHFIRSGSCRVLLDTGEFAASEGEFFVTAPGVYHEQTDLNGRSAVEYCLSCDIKPQGDISGEALKVLSILGGTPCGVFRDTLGIFELFETALNEALMKRVGFHNKLRSLAALILVNSARIMGGQEAAEYGVPLKSNRGDHRYLQINQFIEDNISGAVTVKQIADFLYLSEKQVSRIVRKSAGLSTKELIIKKKIARATDLLRNTRMPINQIAEALGFSSDYYFSQYFRKFYGCPPSYLRK